MTRHKSSAAVMARRTNEQNDLDFYRTPYWATRALLDKLREFRLLNQNHSCLDPCAGAGDMARVLEEDFDLVTRIDIEHYGRKLDFQADFLSVKTTVAKHDWVIANPPFNKAEEFIQKSLNVALSGVAILGRIQLLEGIRRYGQIWDRTPCDYVFIFSERLGFAKGYSDQVQSAACHAWFIWMNDRDTNPACDGPQLAWLPPGTKITEAGLL